MVVADRADEVFMSVQNHLMVLNHQKGVLHKEKGQRKQLYMPQKIVCRKLDFLHHAKKLNSLGFWDPDTFWRDL